MQIDADGRHRLCNGNVTRRDSVTIPALQSVKLYGFGKHAPGQNCRCQPVHNPDNISTES